MGYAPEHQLGKPAIEFIDNELHGPKKKEIKGVMGMMGDFFGSMFGSTVNADGSVSRGCLSALADRVSGWKVKYDDFELKDLFKKKKNKDAVVFPEGGAEGGGAEAEAEQEVFEF